ncbi:TlpA disulfide reductase family protein [Meiothermus sp.]|uniref:TlpA family protein disulfide reductase n=1 Tax=Meiothermus sp. TaxID=1955249 RepID=UPI00307E8253
MKRWLAVLTLFAVGLAVSPGQSAPDFRLRDMAGKVYTLDSFKGKPMVITFWASWCPICRAEFPKLHQLAQEYQVPFVVISREPRDTEQVVRDYMKNYPRFLPLLAQPGGDNPVAVANRYKALGHPWTFVLDGEGKVVNLYAGRVDVESLKDDLALAGYE